MQRTLLAQRLLALFVAGWLLFDFPLLRLALAGGAEEGATATLLGLPRLSLLLFACWGLLIIVLAVWMERAEDEAPDGEAAAAAPEGR